MEIKTEIADVSFGGLAKLILSDHMTDHVRIQVIQHDAQGNPSESSIDIDKYDVPELVRLLQNFAERP